MWESTVPALRRIARAATAGLVTAGAARAVDDDRALTARVRTRRGTPALTAFVAGKGGMGTTTTAVGVSLTLAALRQDTTALVDPRHGTASLGQRLAGAPAPTLARLTEPHDGRPEPEPLRVWGALDVVDGAPWHSPVPPAQLSTAFDRLRARSGFILVDAGTELSARAELVLEHADQVVVVTTSAHDAIESARIALQRVRQARPLLTGTVVVAIVCLTAGRYRRTARALHAALGLPANRIVAVPFDPLLATGGPVDPARLRPASREAFLRLAACVADPGDPDPELSDPMAEPMAEPPPVSPHPRLPAPPTPAPSIPAPSTPAPTQSLLEPPPLPPPLAPSLPPLPRRIPPAVVRGPRAAGTRPVPPVVRGPRAAGTRLVPPVHVHGGVG